MSTLRISKHSDVPAALDLVREEVDKEARRINQAGGAAQAAGSIAAVVGSFLCGLVGKIVARMEENSKRLVGDEFDRAGVGCGLCDII